MIKIVKDLAGYILDEDAWDFPFSEIDYLLETHSGETFWLFEDRLYEVRCI